MRVIGGRFRSRRLKSTPPEGIRPTSDKLKETLFNVLGESVRGCSFLDGYAGMGGIGIEAISRGAAMVYFVDQSRKACRIVRENLESLGIKDGYKILEMDLVKALEAVGTTFNVAFLDPPWDREDLYRNTLEAFAGLPVLSADGVLVVEHSKRVKLPETVEALRRARTIVHGDSALGFYRITVAFRKTDSPP